MYKKKKSYSKRALLRSLFSIILYISKSIHVAFFPVDLSQIF